MSDSNNSLAAEKNLLAEANQKPLLSRWGTFAKLSGPGWLQGAITLGGGSLAGSLYFGVIGGYELLWLQPLMMIFGVLMLSVIGYVTLSTGEKPFRAINKHINPVLGWGWLIAALLANPFGRCRSSRWERLPSSRTLVSSMAPTASTSARCFCL